LKLVVIESQKQCRNNCPDLCSASSCCMKYFANYSYIPVSEKNVDYENVNVEQYLKFIC